MDNMSVGGKTIVGRLSTLQRVHYQRFHCIYTHHTVEHGHVDVLVEVAREPILCPLYATDISSVL